MILELDCGNSFIKWRLLDRHGCRLGDIRVARSVAEITSAALSVEPERVRLVSVRSAPETLEIIQAVKSCWQVPVAVATPARARGGVTNGYREYERLGLDRWLAVIAAYDLYPGPCVVFDLGTAVTVDLVDAAGQHLGGFIAPGLGLMRDQLLRQTRNIRYAPLLPDTGVLDQPGIDTGEAVERGCVSMLRAYVAAQADSARQRLGPSAKGIVTGGDANLVADMDQLLIIPDLVFRGLALAGLVEV